MRGQTAAVTVQMRTGKVWIMLSWFYAHFGHCSDLWPRVVVLCLHCTVLSRHCCMEILQPLAGDRRVKLSEAAQGVRTMTWCSTVQQCLVPPEPCVRTAQHITSQHHTTHLLMLALRLFLPDELIYCTSLWREMLLSVFGERQQNKTERCEGFLKCSFGGLAPAGEEPGRQAVMSPKHLRAGHTCTGSVRMCCVGEVIASADAEPEPPSNLSFCHNVRSPANLLGTQQVDI